MISYTLWFSSHWTEQNFAKLPKIILLYSTNATMEYHTLPCNSTQCISLSQESFVVSTAWTLSGKWCRHVTRLLGSQQLWRPMHCNGPTNANGPIHLTHTQIQTSISSSFLPLLTQFRLLYWCNIDCLKMLHSFRSDAVRIFQMLSSFKFARIHFVAKKPGQFTIDGTWKRRPPYQGGQTGEVYNDFRFARVAGYLHSSEVLDKI